MEQWLVDFFQDESEMLDQLNLFGWQHLLLLAVTLTGGFLLYWFRGRLQRWKYRESLRYWMAGLFFLNMAVFYSVLLVKGVYDWRIHLPFHLCFISGFLFMAVLVTGNRRLFRIIYFFTWIGPLPAMLWPNTPVRFDRFLAWHFFISHHLLLLMGLYCLFVLQYPVERKDTADAFLFGNGIFFFMFLFNSLFQTNYIMTGQLPAHITAMFPFLKRINFPIFWLELCGIAGIALAYLPAVAGRNRSADSVSARLPMSCIPQNRML